MLLSSCEMKAFSSNFLSLFLSLSLPSCLTSGGVPRRQVRAGFKLLQLHFEA